MKKIFYLSALLLFVSMDKVFAQAQSDSVTAQMDTVFKKYMLTKGPGCAVAVIRDGGVIFNKSYGLANLEYNQPINAASLFDICSLTKQFTGLAISMLVQEGKISLNDDIRKYLPRVPDFGKIITINNLVHQTSGLRDYPEALTTAGWRYSELCTLDDVMKLVAHQRELDFEPGSKQSYCNTGYVLLAVLVEKVTGQSFPNWMMEHIFKPLSMNASFIIDNSRTVVPGLATSYAITDRGYFKYPDILTSYGSSCMYSSLDDLVKWDIHFQEMIQLKDPIYMRMLEGSLLDNGEKVNYGFGLELGEFQGLRTIWHTGAWAGYRTLIINYPDQHFAIITVCNADDNDIGGLYAREIAAIFLKGNLKTNGEEIARIKSLPAIKLESSFLQKYTGKFKMTGNGPTLNFTIENGQLVGHNGNVSFSLEARSDSCFFDPSDGATITFVSDRGKTGNAFIFRDAALTINAGRTTAEPVKTVMFAPSAEQLKTYTGTYYSDELETFYSVDIEGGKLMIHHFRRGDFDMNANKEALNEFNSNIGIIDFYFNGKSQVSGFKLSGDRIRNIRFVKKQVGG